MARDITTLRNIGIIAHIDAGKTTLTERMLYYSGTIHRMGDVDKGTTQTDFDTEERERGITIYSACVTFKWKDVIVNLIDTPGHVDFTAEVERSLRVLDGGVVVFSAREGVEAQSETVWRQADKYHVPRVAFINKMDREGADFFGTFKEIRERLGSNPIAIQIPIGAGPPHMKDAFSGVIDLIEMQQLTFFDDEKSWRVETGPIPAEVQDDAELWRGQMLEQLYNFSDQLMELALAEEPIPSQLIRDVLRKATISNNPTLCSPMTATPTTMPIKSRSSVRTGHPCAVANFSSNASSENSLNKSEQISNTSNEATAIKATSSANIKPAWPKMKFCKPAALPLGTRCTTESKAMPAPKKILSTIACAASSLIRVQRRMPTVTATPARPAANAPSNKPGTDLPCPGCQNSCSKNARHTPGSEACPTTSPTSDRLRNSMNVPTTPAVIPKRSVPSRTTRV